jgi:hypothetical protein
MNPNKTVLILGAAFMSMVWCFGYAQSGIRIGSIAPMLDRNMEDITGRNLNLREAAQSNGLLIVFTSNTCPWVMKWEDRYSVISQLAKTNNIGMIAINPNEDYRQRGDGMDDMKKRAAKMNYDFPYVLDAGHNVADAFGASHTPQVYLFDKELKLVYMGAIDDSPNNAASVKEFYLKTAIEQLIAGNKIIKSSTRSQGCSIKRVG